MFQLHQSFGYILNQAARTMANALAASLKPYDLTPYHFGTLVVLAEEEGINQKELARRTYDDEPTTKRVVDKLMAKKLVVRKPHPTDRRAYRLYLTDGAREVLPSIIAEAEKTNGEIARRFTPEEFRELTGLLKRIGPETSEPGESR